MVKKKEALLVEYDVRAVILHTDSEGMSEQKPVRFGSKMYQGPRQVTGMAVEFYYNDEVVLKRFMTLDEVDKDAEQSGSSDSSSADPVNETEGGKHGET
jgi:hypothetical protein